MIINEGNLITICGSNNVGKTNFLRELNLFFDPKIENFSAEEDIPYHIVEGSRGQGYAISLKAKIIEIESKITYSISQSFTKKKGEKKITLKGKKDNTDLTEKEIRDFLTKNFKFFLVEASNVNIPKLVSEILNDEILPLGLDKRRGKNQKDSLAKLDEFIELSKQTVGKVENELTKIFQSLLKDNDDINSLNSNKIEYKFFDYNSILISKGFITNDRTVINVSDFKKERYILKIYGIKEETHHIIVE